MVNMKWLDKLTGKKQKTEVKQEKELTSEEQRRAILDKEKEEARIALHDFIRATKNKKYIYSSVNKKKLNSRFNILKKLKENYFSKIIIDTESKNENEPLLKNKEYTNVNHLKLITNKFNKLDCIIS